MKLKDLPLHLQLLAMMNCLQYVIKYGREVDFELYLNRGNIDLIKCFFWQETKEGFDFWLKVDRGVFPRKVKK